MLLKFTSGIRKFVSFLPHLQHMRVEPHLPIYVIAVGGRIIEQGSPSTMATTVASFRNRLGIPWT